MARPRTKGRTRTSTRKARADQGNFPSHTDNDIEVGAVSSEANAVMPLVLPLTLQCWHAAAAAVVGSAHLRIEPPKPCQDAALADVLNRPLAVLADGAGSAQVSHIGAGAVVFSVRRLCRTIEADIAAVLDSDKVLPGLAEALAHRIIVHAKGVLEDLSEAHWRDVSDFRCTLLVWLIGRHRALWLKVGDGELIAESGGISKVIGPAGKGEFANQTTFLGPHLTVAQWAWGEIDSTMLTGVALMSDGAAERLVAHDAARVSPAITKLLQGTAKGLVACREVFGLLAEHEFWKGSSGDDKSLALLACATKSDDRYECR